MLFQKTQVYKLGFTTLGSPSGLLTTFLRRWGLRINYFFKILLKMYFYRPFVTILISSLIYNSAEQDIQVILFFFLKKITMTFLAKEM